MPSENPVSDQLASAYVVIPVAAIHRGQILRVSTSVRISPTAGWKYQEINDAAVIGVGNFEMEASKPLDRFPIGIIDDLEMKRIVVRAVVTTIPVLADAIGSDGAGTSPEVTYELRLFAGEAAIGVYSRAYAIATACFYAKFKLAIQ